MTKHGWSKLVPVRVPVAALLASLLSLYPACGGSQPLNGNDSSAGAGAAQDPNSLGGSGGSGGTGNDAEQSVACLYTLKSWTSCTEGVSSEWRCENGPCAEIRALGESVVAGCITGGAKVDRFEMTGRCAELLPPGAGSPQLPSPKVERHDDPDTLLACLRALERDKSCAETIVDPRCMHFAGLESPDAVAEYERIANTPCGVAYESSLPPSTLGTELCREFAESCDETIPTEACTEDNAATAWLRADVQDALRSCLGRPCSYLKQCLDSWVRQVYPPSPNG